MLIREQTLQVVAYLLYSLSCVAHLRALGENLCYQPSTPLKLVVSSGHVGLLLISRQVPPFFLAVLS